jgi:hypothetical protein
MTCVGIPLHPFELGEFAAASACEPAEIERQAVCRPIPFQVDVQQLCIVRSADGRGIGGKKICARKLSDDCSRQPNTAGNARSGGQAGEIHGCDITRANLHSQRGPHGAHRLRRRV